MNTNSELSGRLRPGHMQLAEINGISGWLIGLPLWTQGKDFAQYLLFIAGNGGPAAAIELNPIQGRPVVFGYTATLCNAKRTVPRIFVRRDAIGVLGSAQIAGLMAGSLDKEKPRRDDTEKVVFGRIASLLEASF